MIIRLLITAIFICARSLDALAQPKEFRFKNFTQEEGLPGNECYFVYSDSKHYTWIATETGVVRFDGNKMEHIDLPDNVVFKIREDGKGRIWFFSQSGKFAYFFNEQVHPYKYNDIIAPHLKDILITNAYVNDADEIIINSANLWNYKILKSGVVERTGYFYKKMSDQTVLNITAINPNEMFARFELFNYWNSLVQVNINDNGKQVVYHLSIGNDSYQQYNCIKTADHYYLFMGRSLFCLAPDGTFKVKRFKTEILGIKSIDNNIWVGLLKGGAVVLNKNFDELNFDAVLGDLSITAITNDYEGGIWFSTLEKGVFYLKNTHVYLLSGDSSLSQQVYRISKQADTAFLFANKHGIYKFSNDKTSIFFTLENNGVYDLFQDERNNLFIAARKLSKDTILTLMNVRRLKNNYLKNLVLIESGSEVVKLPADKYIFSQGNILVQMDLGRISPDELSNDISFGSDTTSERIFHTSDVKGNLYNYQSWNGYIKKIPVSRQTNLFYHGSAKEGQVFSPRVLYSDINSRLWVGTRDNLFNFNNELNTPTAFKTSQEIFNNGVNAISQLKNGIYVFGIRLGGIVLMRDSNIIASITEANGLLSNSVKYLLPMDNYLWVATSKGISVIKFNSFEPLKYTIENIGKKDGLHNVIINQLIPFKNNILAASNNGVYVIENPAFSLKQDPIPVPFYINSISYYGGDTNNIESLSLPYKNNRLTVRYSAVSFNSSEELKYYYRFANKDTNWIATASTELLLENISPGNYDLELKANIPNQQRSSGILAIKITVEKPYWQKTWVQVIAFAIFLGLIFLLYTIRVRKLKKKERLKASQKARMLELEQAALRSQMNPHFVFNSLSSIQHLIISGKNLEANNYLVSFARLIRKTLELSSKAYIKIAEEKEYLAEYLNLEMLRIPGAFDFNIEMDEDIKNVEIPNMMLQPIVENSIRHGIKHLETKKGHINISISKEPGCIICAITDNGVGRNVYNKGHEILFPGHKSYGMEVVSKRLELMSNEKSHYAVEIHDLKNKETNEPEGTSVILRLPYKMTTV